MGLDMHLYRKTFLWTGDYINEDARDSIAVTKGGKTHPAIKNDRIKYVVEEVGYWRKANHIHKWFVDNVQDGVDDCDEYEVEEEKLRELLETCKIILNDDPSKASVLLPTSDGFFFGGTEYDQYYFGTIIETINIIESVLSENGDGQFYYRASW